MNKTLVKWPEYPLETNNTQAQRDMTDAIQGR